jgi:predicted NBD/HSP70 family sugar kinase
LSKLSPKPIAEAGRNSLTVPDLVARARHGDAKALTAIQATARFLGLGLGTITNVLNPDSIYLAGEIIAAWDLIESTVREALSERALTESAGRTPLRLAGSQEYPRLRGAAALIAAPTFAAPRVA